MTPAPKNIPQMQSSYTVLLTTLTLLWGLKPLWLLKPAGWTMPKLKGQQENGAQGTR